MDDLVFIFTTKRSLHFRHFRLEETTETRVFVSDLRGRMNTAELHTSGAKRSRDRSGTDSVRPKLPPLYVSVSSSPVSREARRGLQHSIGPSAMVLFKL